MSHGDRVTALPPGFKVIGTSRTRRSRSSATKSANSTAQFHPEVMHTPNGAALLRNFVHKIAGLRATGRCAPSRRRRSGNPQAGRQGPRDLRAVRRGGFRGRRRAHPRSDRRPAHLHLRRSRACCGGRSARRSMAMFRGIYNIPLVHVDAADPFFDALAGVEDPGAQAQDDRSSSSSRSSRRKRRKSAAPSSSPRARSIRT